ncbi:hypothetical protein Tco_1262615 [Tanacetum coccineum]
MSEVHLARFNAVRAFDNHRIIGELEGVDVSNVMSHREYVRFLNKAIEDLMYPLPKVLQERLEMLKKKEHGDGKKRRQVELLIKKFEKEEDEAEEQMKKKEEKMKKKEKKNKKKTKKKEKSEVDYDVSASAVDHYPDEATKSDMLDYKRRMDNRIRQRRKTIRI